MDELRMKAEGALSHASHSEELPLEDARRLVHELRVHQVELEMQNEALRESQAALEESNSRYTDLYDFAPVGYFSIDERSIIVQANLTLAKLLGVERGVLVGRSFANFIRQNEKSAFRSRLVRLFETGERQTFDTWLMARGGETCVAVQLESILVENGVGRKQCRLSVVDISERKKAEEAGNAYMNKLERSNKALEEFAFIASHDLQEPLRKIQAFGARLEGRCSGILDEQGFDNLHRMMNASKRMSDMVRGLLDYSRISTKERTFEFVDLTHLVKEVLSDLELIIERGGARIEVGPLPTLEADSNQMRQLFQNIVSNALKFHGEEEPVIKIYARPSGGLEGALNGKVHRVFVEDNGIGFDEAHLERIFTLFQRLHGRSAYEGTGMGLAICRRIVDNHHGSITARSKPGEGATFIITLPEKQPAVD